MSCADSRKSQTREGGLEGREGTANCGGSSRSASPLPCPFCAGEGERGRERGKGGGTPKRRNGGTGELRRQQPFGFSSPLSVLCGGGGERGRGKGDAEEKERQIAEAAAVRLLLSHVRSVRGRGREGGRRREGTANCGGRAEAKKTRSTNHVAIWQRGKTKAAAKN